MVKGTDPNRIEDTVVVVNLPGRKEKAAGQCAFGVGERLLC